jgi:ribosome-associated translation inhibitor RaiA
MVNTNSLQAADIEVTFGGGIPAAATAAIAADARRRLAAVASQLRHPVLSARVRVTRHGDPAAANPFTAQANVDLNGRLLRVQVGAPTAGEALAQLEDKLRRVAERAAARWKDRSARRSAAAPREDHEWRHIFEPARRPSYYPRPPADRRVVRHKAFGLAVCTTDEAAFDMEALDYDFHLFTELGSGQDSVLSRDENGHWTLTQLTPRPAKVIKGAVPLTVSTQPAPVLTEAEAVQRLNLSGEPFLFFRQPDGHRRGQVLYRRYDGHYGLITPAG